MEILRTKTGREFKSDYMAVIPVPPQVFIRVAAPLAVVAEVFSNSAETEQLWYGNDYLAGYTRLVAVIPESGAVKVCLARE